MKQLFTILLFCNLLMAQISVKTKGAVGDNLHDDTAAFNASIDAACEKPGGIVWVPKGSYRLSPFIARCTGLQIVGESEYGVILNFATGNTYAIVVAQNLRGIAMQNFIINVIGNNRLGCLSILSGAFSDHFSDIYCILPPASSAYGISTFDPGGIGSMALIDFDRVRVDNGVHGFHFQNRGTGDLLSCRLCYADGAKYGFYINGWFLVTLNTVAADGNAIAGYNFDSDGTVLVNGATSEKNTGVPFYISGGGQVILNAPMTQSSRGLTNFKINNPKAIVNINNPQTVDSAAATSVTITAVHYFRINTTTALDKPMDASAIAASKK